MNAFSHCKLGKAIFLDQLDFPNDKPRNEVMVPYYLVTDDAFPLSKRIMKPYSLRNLIKAELVFSYWLSRARRVVESAFGKLSHKWMAVPRTLMCHPDRAKNIVAACCLLHNYVLRRCPLDYNINEHINPVLHPLPAEFTQFRGRVQEYPRYVRDSVKNYVNNPRRWQNNQAGHKS